MLARLIDRLQRTRERVAGGLRRLLAGGTLDDATLDRMEELLYTSDLGPAAGALMDSLRQARARGELNDPAQVEPLVRARLRKLLGPAATPPPLGGPPHVVLAVGVNGSGKTTSVAKLAQLHQRQGRSVLLAACDTYRAAAADQLQVWADRLDAPLVRAEPGTDPSGLAFEAADQATRSGAQVLLVDTAGRLHTQRNLMAELAKLARVLGKRVAGAPHETLLVLDGTTGQNAIAQARTFAEAVPLSSVLVAKLDGTARGGALVSIRQQLDLPVAFVGVGEGLDDLQPFEPEAFLDALFDGG